MDRVLVTGGAGFIGSHLVDRLIQDNEVVVLDDLSAGLEENMQQHQGNERFRFIKGSITREKDLRVALDGITTVFHFAAQPDVRLSAERPIWDFEINVRGSLELLEAMRKNDVQRMVFASSGGTVYGETDVFPTPEVTAFRPISNYGAAKGAFEMYLNSYAELYGIDSVSMRFANVIGPRSTHGVMHDFYLKLKRNPKHLEVLGDGTQDKAYIYISDTVEAALVLAENIGKGHFPVNVSSGERLTVTRIAELVCQELGVPDAQIVYAGGKRGWIGDVVRTDISITKLASFGWAPRVPLEKGVKLYLRWLIKKFGSVK
jgi:UDP-glucose 4-epimerase